MGAFELVWVFYLLYLNEQSLNSRIRPVLLSKPTSYALTFNCKITINNTEQQTMKTFNKNQLYYLILFHDKNLSQPEISTVTFESEYLGPGNNAVYQFVSTEENEPPMKYRFHDDASAVFAFEEMVEVLNDTLEIRRKLKLRT